MKKLRKELDDYARKRDFGKSPEPAPGTAAVRGVSRVFVVHRHEATHLHYDLRLEMDGVLKSWAVPRGFSYITGEKRLAVRTEDHPLEYEHFDGVIPKGQYGAGTMTIWDKGEYEILKGDDPVGALARGKLELRLRGTRLRGEWHLVETRAERNEWLLLKGSDVYSRDQEDLPYPFGIDLRRARRSGFPRKLEPMRAEARARPFSDPDWLFEMAFRGLRVFAVKQGTGVLVKNATTGEKLEDGLEHVRRAIGAIRAENAVLDGVLVSLDERERPCRKTLEEGLRGESESPISLCVFDLLYYDEWNTRMLPLIERKRLLAALLPRRSALSYVEHVLGEGEKYVSAASEAALPGVVAKEAAGVYRGGPSSSWRVIEVEARSEVDEKGALELLKVPERRRQAYGRVAYTNMNKVFWPELGYTKGDILRYYERVGEYLLPYLHERPLHMRRFPDGIDGKSFYHHNAPDHTPDWVTTERIGGPDEKDRIRYVICNDRETLLYLVNLGSVDLHPWMSRRGSLDTPDWLVLDLDPDAARDVNDGFSKAIKAARAIGKLLRGIGLRPYLKTSGSRGLHITLPLEPRYTYDQARVFGEGVARYIAHEHRDLCTVERNVARRRGRVYIDFLQNRRGQTVVPPYVVRPVPAATVSTPLDWDELSSDLRVGEFTMEHQVMRVARMGDLFHATLTDRQDLGAAIDAFQEMLKS